MLATLLFTKSFGKYKKSKGIEYKTFYVRFTLFMAVT